MAHGGKKLRFRHRSLLCLLSHSLCLLDGNQEIGISLLQGLGPLLNLILKIYVQALQVSPHYIEIRCQQPNFILSLANIDGHEIPVCNPLGSVRQVLHRPDKQLMKKQIQDEDNAQGKAEEKKNKMARFLPESLLDAVKFQADFDQAQDGTIRNYFLCDNQDIVTILCPIFSRSEERRVGKECRL